MKYRCHDIINFFIFLNFEKTIRQRSFCPSEWQLTLVDSFFIELNLRCSCVKIVRIRSYSGLHFSRIFPHSDWIRRDTSCLSVFSANARKMWTRITQNTDTFNVVVFLRKFKEAPSAVEEIIVLKKISSGISTDTLCSSNVVLMDNLRPPASHSVCLFGVFQVRIFPHSDSIKFPVISPNARKYGWEKFQIRTLLTQYQSHQIQWNLAKLHKNSQRSLLKKQVQKLILYPNQFFWLESHRWGCWIV